MVARLPRPHNVDQSERWKDKAMDILLDDGGLVHNMYCQSCLKKCELVSAAMHFICLGKDRFTWMPLDVLICIAMRATLKEPFVLVDSASTIGVYLFKRYLNHWYHISEASFCSSDLGVPYKK